MYFMVMNIFSRLGTYEDDFLLTMMLTACTFG